MMHAAMMMHQARHSASGFVVAYQPRVPVAEWRFAALSPDAVLFHESEEGAAVTKAQVLKLCSAAPQSAYRLYVAACRCAETPVTVLSRDLFEMPERRQFPELAAAFDAAPVFNDTY